MYVLMLNIYIYILILFKDFSAFYIKVETDTENKTIQMFFFKDDNFAINHYYLTFFLCKCYICFIAINIGYYSKRNIKI